MNALIKSMKTQFAESTAIVAAVGSRCKFIVNLQEEKEFPLIVYNAKEVGPVTKDSLREYDLTVSVLAQNVKDLLDIYEISKQVMDNDTTDFLSLFIDSSYPEFIEGRDDLWIVDINYKVNYKSEY